MKKKYIALILGIMIIGIFYWLSDKHTETKHLEEIKTYPVIVACDLSTYNAEEGDMVVVDKIHVSGTKTTDSQNILDGEYYYIKADVSSYYKDSENKDTWIYESGMSYDVYNEDLKFEGFENEVFNPSTIRLSANAGEITYNYGKEKASFTVISDRDTLVALAQYKAGAWYSQKLYSDSEYEYILGTVDDYYQYLEDYMVGDSLGFYGLAIIAALIVAFFGWIDYAHTKKKT